MDVIITCSSLLLYFSIHEVIAKKENPAKMSRLDVVIPFGQVPAWLKENQRAEHVVINN